MRRNFLASLATIFIVQISANSQKLTTWILQGTDTVQPQRRGFYSWDPLTLGWEGEKVTEIEIVIGVGPVAAFSQRIQVDSLNTYTLDVASLRQREETYRVKKAKLENQTPPPQSSGQLLINFKNPAKQNAVYIVPFKLVPDFTWRKDLDFYLTIASWNKKRLYSPESNIAINDLKNALGVVTISRENKEWYPRSVFAKLYYKGELRAEQSVVPSQVTNLKSSFLLDRIAALLPNSAEPTNEDWQVLLTFAFIEKVSGRTLSEKPELKLAIRY